MSAHTPDAPPSIGQPFWLKKIFQAGFRLAFGGVDVHGMDGVPADGPLIVASNHRSYLDPLIIASFLPRPVHHMAKQELFRNPLLAGLITFFGAFPVDRESTRPSTFRMALRLLRRNAAVVIFPEGGIVDSSPGEAGVKEGIGTLAVMSRAPVLPVCIAGSNSLISPRGILNPWLSIRVGGLITPSSDRPGKPHRREVAQSVADAIRRLEADALAAQKRQRDK